MTNLIPNPKELSVSCGRYCKALLENREKFSRDSTQGRKNVVLRNAKWEDLDDCLELVNSLVRRKQHLRHSEIHERSRG